MKRGKSLWFLLLSHHGPSRLHRTFHLRVVGKDVYLCARCTGIFLGFITAFFLFSALSSATAFVLMALFPLPTAADWVTQTLGLRESKNWIRVGTGYLLGVAWGFFLSFLIGGNLKIFLYGLMVLAVYYGAIYTIARKTGMLRNYFHGR